jgi:hypothetical protein
MRSLPLFLVSAVACSGGDETTEPQPTPTCDDLTSAPLSGVPVTDWPDGLPEALATYDAVGGVYEATLSEECGGGPVTVKLVPRTQEDLLIVTEPWPAASVLTCGCVTDPRFEDDTTYDIAALIPEFDFYIQFFGDPGIDNQNVVGSGALFSPSAPLTLRECGTMNVDANLGSIYEQFTTIFRVEAGVYTGAITLAKTDGTNVACEITDWEFIEGL